MAAEDLDKARTLRPSEINRAEKESIALGKWPGVPGLLPFAYCDGGNGVRGAEGATAFPSALAVAASFDTDLARRYGVALGAEVRAAGCNVLLGPVLDVARTPWDGRTGEGLGEDPELTAQIGGAIIEGVQSEGVISVAKHVVANNAEIGRTGDGPAARRTDAIDVRVDEKTLHEVYLRPFRRAIQQHGLAGLMGSYNRLGGRYVCENTEVWRIVRDEWDFTGVTVPDYLFAIRDDAAALDAGMDLPGLDDIHGRTAEMVSALDDEHLDRLVGHVLLAAEMVRLEPATAVDKSALGSVPTRELAEEIAVSGAVLLKNSGLLPLAPGTKVALFTPHSLDHITTIGGSAAVSAPQGRATGLGPALSDLGFSVDEMNIVAADLPLPAATASEGLRLIQAIISTARGVDDRRLQTFAVAAAEVDADEWSAVVRGEFVAPLTGGYRVTATFAGRAELFVRGVPEVAGFREASPLLAGPEYPMHAVFAAVQGERIDIELRYETGPALSIPGTSTAPALRVGVQPLDDPTRLAEAARRADVAIVVVGRASGESMDVESLRLPPDQERLIESVAGAQANTVVVTLGSGPLAMPWHALPPAILHMWQAGERAGTAIGALLSGHGEPGGRLPLTFPYSDDDVPLDPGGYPGLDNRAEYTERAAVGYRGYQERGIDPLFPFGHGLGYASIELGEVTWEVGPTTISALANVHNSGSRAGSVVLQLYARRPGEDSWALAGFGRSEMPPAGEEEIVITTAVADLAARLDGGWLVVSGEYQFAVGLSSTDLHAMTTVAIEPDGTPQRIRG